ncbi:MAG: patatin-like phospholipase family protein [Candidatus Promineifilaceae bacterium]
MLTLDGGGIRGLFTAVLLRRLEERVPGWLQKVDLVAGTSTGGILALGLAHGLSPQTLQQLYYEKCAEVFADSWWDNVLDLGQLIGAQFSSSNLAHLIDAVVGTETLGELQKRVLISTFDLDNEDPDPLKRQWKPKFFHNFPGIDSDADALARDVALYTSAAPTYFPVVNGYVDGGVVANNPSMAALAQVFDERAYIPNRPNLSEIRLLSIGTGSPLKFIDSKGKESLDWGYLQWARPILDIMMEGGMGIPDYQCRQLLGERQYRRIDPVLTENIGVAACDKRDDLIQFAEQYDIEEIVTWLKIAWG